MEIAKDKQLLLIRYGELGLKGRNKNIFIHKLVHNIRTALKGLDGCDVTSTWGRVWVTAEPGQAAEALQRLRCVFGIYSISPAHAAEKELHQALEGWGMQAQSLRPLGNAAHIFSHVEWRMTGWLVRVRGEGPFTWAAPEELEERYALPSAFRAYRPACLEGGAFAAADTSPH